MSVDKLVDSTQLDSDLTSVANAIRAKTGKSASMQFPAEFVSEIEGIEKGYSADGIATNTEPSGSIVITSSSIKRAAFAHKPITAVESQTVTSIDTDAFRSCGNLTSALFPSVTNITGGYAFAECTQLSKIDFSELQRISTSYIFMSDRALLVGVFPKLTYANQSFRMSGFITIDFGAQINISTYLFVTSSDFNKLILRSSTMCPLGNINAFDGTPFASGKAGGTLYVPSALISSYESATNWSTILGYENNSIKAIEGSQYENYYADGMPIPTT